MDDLDKNIEDRSATIPKLLDMNDNAKAIESAKRGVVHTLGNEAKSVCVHLKSFLKTFFSVAVQGPAVHLLILIF